MVMESTFQNTTAAFSFTKSLTCHPKEGCGRLLWRVEQV